MLGNRRVFEQIVISAVSRISNLPENVQFYKDKFAKMTDAEFHQFVQDIKAKRVRLSVVEPNYSDKGYVSDEVLMDIAKEYGVDIMQHLYVEGKEGMPTYRTNVKFPVIMVPIRRASQMLTKKISVPPHTRVRDLLTGQVTGESKGATVSGPEVQLLAAMGAEAAAVEMLKFRGGDIRGEAALMAMLSKYGKASQQVLSQFSSGVQAKAALNTFLTAAMHRVNL